MTDPSAAPLGAEPRPGESFVAALAEPDALFRRVRGVEGVASPLGFAAGLGFLVGAIDFLIVTLLVGWLFARRQGGGSGEFAVLAAPLVLLKALLLDPLYWALGALASSLAVAGVAALSGGRGSWSASLRVAAYALAPIAFLAVADRGLLYVPFLRLARIAVPYAQVGWWAWVVASGVATLQGGQRSRALSFSLLAGAVFLLLRIAARH